MKPNNPNELAELESLEDRDIRALTEYILVTELGGGIFLAYSEDGTQYGVDLVEGRCTCPDHKYRDAECKHRRRCAYWVGIKDVPECGRSAMDPLLVERVEARESEDGHADADAHERAVAADGGQLVEEDAEAEITGPHHDTDEAGEAYTYHRCESCGLETTDETIADRGCWRCGG